MIAPRPLPKSGLVLSPLGLGTAALGDLRGDDAAETAAKTLGLALASGVTYVDTAPHYGLGVAERRAGAALATCPRNRFTLSTKVGRLINEDVRTETFDFSPGAVLSSLETSLRRLGLAAVDIVYVHDPDHAEEAASRDAFPALRELRGQGIVTAIGAGMNQAAMLERFVANPELGIDLVLLAGRYTLLDQSGLRLLEICREREVGVVLGGVFNSGILADPRPGASYDYHPAPGELVERAWSLANVCERHGVALPAVALQFGWGHPAVVSVLNGAGSPEELTANLRHAETVIPAECWEDLRSQGLLPRGLPVPGEL